jgi:hypothetical protein
MTSFGDAVWASASSVIPALLSMYRSAWVRSGSGGLLGLTYSPQRVSRPAAPPEIPTSTDDEQVP